MNYRDNELRNVLISLYEESKATLEDLAEQEVVCLPDAEDALQTIGFRKETGIGHKYIGPLVIYSRETADNIELLVDRDLADVGEKTPHLYRLPAGKDVQELLYNSFINPNSWRIKYNQEFNDIGLVIMAGGFFLGTPLGYFLDQHFGAYIGMFLTPVIAGGAALLYRDMKKHPIHNHKLIAKGPAALRYIAENTNVEDVKIVPKFRIEEQLQNDQEAELELLAEESAKRIFRKW